MARILYLGGTGTISTASVRRSLERGDDVWTVTRGTGRRPVPEGVHELVADVRDPKALAAVTEGERFDAVADFLSFSPGHVESNLDVLAGRIDQYVFVSSASAYQKPPAALPVTEGTPLHNPFWEYSREKIACEDLLLRVQRERGLPVTIVRPSHTYDERMIPTLGKWGDIARMREGRPVVVHGDGTSLWTITHADDVAVAFASLLANPAAHGEAYTITGSHAPSWNQIHRWLAEAAGAGEPDLVHVASETIAAFSPSLGPTLLGDKAHSMLFDNTKVTALVPEFTTTTTFDEGAKMIVAYYDAHPEEQTIDADAEERFDRMIAHARSAG